MAEMRTRSWKGCTLAHTGVANGLASCMPSRSSTTFRQRCKGWPSRAGSISSSRLCVTSAMKSWCSARVIALRRPAMSSCRLSASRLSVARLSKFVADDSRCHGLRCSVWSSYGIRQECKQATNKEAASLLHHHPQGARRSEAASGSSKLLPHHFGLGLRSTGDSTCRPRVLLLVLLRRLSMVSALHNMMLRQIVTSHATVTSCERSHDEGRLKDSGACPQHSCTEPPCFSERTAEHHRAAVPVRTAPQVDHGSART